MAFFLQSTKSIKMPRIAVVSISSSRFVNFVHGGESCSFTNIEVTGERKLIVSLHFQLYSKCRQLRSRHEIHEEFVFCLEELHTVFAMLKVIWKCIEENDLDKILADSEIYTENTWKHILDGKDIKMSVKTHTTFSLALSWVFINDWYNRSTVSKLIIENL